MTDRPATDQQITDQAIADVEHYVNGTFDQVTALPGTERWTAADYLAYLAAVATIAVELGGGREIRVQNDTIDPPPFDPNFAALQIASAVSRGDMSTAVSLLEGIDHQPDASAAYVDVHGALFDLCRYFHQAQERHS